VRWRLDLRDELQRRFGVALHERSVGNVRGDRQSRRPRPRWRRPGAPATLCSRTQPDRKRLEYLRGNKLAATVFGDDIVDKTCDAWNFLSKIQCALRQSNPNMDNGQ
jgi:hypothetical protein